MDEQQNLQQSLAQLGEAIGKVITAFTEAFTPVIAAFATALEKAAEQSQDARYYKQATGLDYNTERIVLGSVYVPLLPERAESLNKEAH